MAIDVDKLIYNANKNYKVGEDMLAADIKRLHNALLKELEESNIGEISYTIDTNDYIALFNHYYGGVFCYYCTELEKVLGDLLVGYYVEVRITLEKITIDVICRM
jgi:hypothetical protein